MVQQKQIQRKRNRRLLDDIRRVAKEYGAIVEYSVSDNIGEIFFTDEPITQKAKVERLQIRVFIEDTELGLVYAAPQADTNT